MSESQGQARPVLQKLLTHGLGTAIVEEGYDQVGGVVVLAGDARPLDTPAKLLRAYGVDGEPEFVDVVRFELPPVATLGNPASPDSGRTPLYRTGFLRADAVVPVWELDRTRYSFGAEYWRIRSDGEQRCLSAYQGAGRGWRGAKGWRPWSPLVGTRARWRGSEFVADLVADSVLLSVRADEMPDGWEQVRPQTWTAAVSRSASSSRSSCARRGATCRCASSRPGPSRLGSRCWSTTRNVRTPPARRPWSRGSSRPPPHVRT